MLLLLEHHFLVTEKGEVWCERVVDNAYIQRYLSVYDSVTILARGKKVDKINPHWNKVSGENIDFVYLPEFSGVFGLVRNLFKIFHTVKHMGSYNCCIMRVPSMISLLLFPFLQKKSKVTGIEMVMAADKFFLQDNVFFYIANKFIDAYVKHLCMSAYGVAYVTKSFLQKKYPCTYYVNGTGITGEYSSIDLQNEFFFLRNKKYGFNKIRLVHTGYMDDDRKGQKVAIMALDVLRNKGVDAQLTFIGDGDKRKELELKVKKMKLEKYVSFKGIITDKMKLRQVLIDSDIFIMPTRSEGLPRSIIEAMAVGLPCITSDVDGIPEMIDSKYMVSDFSPHTYAEKVEFLIKNINEYNKVAEENYNKALKYRKTNLDQKRIEFYTKLKNKGI